MFQKFVNAFRIQRAGHLSNQGRYDEAILVLGKVSGGPEQNAYIQLLLADIYFRADRIKEARNYYTKFLTDGVSLIKTYPDQAYLRAYASYYLKQLAQKSGDTLELSSTRGEVRALSEKASVVTKADFVPP